jgi:hypothetical protein
MVWLFERAEDSPRRETMRVETRVDAQTHEFVLLVTSHGEEKTERFADEAGFRAYLEALEAQLQLEGWKQSATIMLRDGWKVG